MSTTTLTDRDAAIVARLTALFEERAGADAPLSGDAVEIWHPEKGRLYERAHLERAAWCTPGHLGVCTQPYAPFCWASTSGLAFEASGGYWQNVSLEQLSRFVRVATIDKQFWTWGWAGPRAHGGVSFTAPVALWRYTDVRFY